MSAIKCIVINGNGNPITNEDGTAYIYDSIKEARAEIRANGYVYNRANDRYYFKAEDGTEYRAYILREGTPDYDYAIEKTAQNAAPEYISPEAIQTVAGQTIYKSVDPVTNDLVYTVSGRDFWTVAEARYFAKYARECAADASRSARYNASHCYSDHETSAYAAEAVRIESEHVARAEAAADRAEAAADRAEAEETIYNHMQDAADKAAQAYKAFRAAEDADDHETAAAYAQQAEEHAAAAKEAAKKAMSAAKKADSARADSLARIARDHAKEARKNADRATETAEQNAVETRAKFDSPYLIWDYQRYELEAYLGEPQDYDVEAIEAEATAYDPETDSRIWTASGEDLARICERHQIATYYPAAV